ncbi:hypothetical protein H8356DRAFT_1064537 [Neocallimastix lanati (nom. inval.)]|uniref:Uncharacterized protein n=1 Tax=Neocallimastix californiae TaxID=1754190 RepID=A0A1Y1Y5V0_9FUNG|nr:hypothetical protein H8356DRAFT_1064537 [Neocallimastix sp. JGI-2020a]ORX93339.1 hypothetical protein LY90DRAFT_261361 [Neocallimastix californiae]|eukprot:ORX93339.1 hypothetical protein LY90DRAFT_261361 [Neocallimastix californiae]
MFTFFPIFFLFFKNKILFYYLLNYISINAILIGMCLTKYCTIASFPFRHALSNEISPRLSSSFTSAP